MPSMAPVLRAATEGRDVDDLVQAARAGESTAADWRVRSAWPTDTSTRSIVVNPDKLTQVGRVADLTSLVTSASRTRQR